MPGIPAATAETLTGHRPYPRAHRPAARRGFRGGDRGRGPRGCTGHAPCRNRDRRSRPGSHRFFHRLRSLRARPRARFYSLRATIAARGGGFLFYHRHLHARSDRGRGRAGRGRPRAGAGRRSGCPRSGPRPASSGVISAARCLAPTAEGIRHSSRSLAGPVLPPEPGVARPERTAPRAATRSGAGMPTRAAARSFFTAPRRCRSFWQVMAPDRLRQMDMAGNPIEVRSALRADERGHLLEPDSNCTTSFCSGR